jgi:phosphatidylserine decarboxylase
MSAVTYATAQILRVLPRARISQVAGHLADVRWSEGVGRAVVALYSRLYDVSLDECAHRGPWPSFDAFFTRELKNGARDVGGDPRTILSPADGRIESLGRVGLDRRFMVKGRPYSVEELVGSAAEAERFTGGAGFVVYLSPRDYHRVHAPVGGVVRRIRSMPGDYFPVNGIGLAHVPNLFVRNRRVAFDIEADGGADGPGRVTVVMVAAIVVGRITAKGVDARDVPFGDHVFDPPLRVERGGELGIFHLGSTAVVFVEERAAGTWLASEGPVRYGQPLLRRPVEAGAAKAVSLHANGSAR